MKQLTRQEVALGGDGAEAVVVLTGDPEAVGRVLAELAPIIAAEQHGWLKRARANGMPPSGCGGCGE